MAKDNTKGGRAEELLSARPDRYGQADKASSKGKTANGDPGAPVIGPWTVSPKIFSAWLFIKDLARLLPAIIFSAVTILIVRTLGYTRPMSRFFWSSYTDTSALTDSFSLGKVICIIICTVMALAVMLVKALDKKPVRLEKSRLYIYMAVYGGLALVSYIFSDLKEFSLMGANDRFEGLIPILCYLIMLLFTANIVKSERDLKMILWPVGVSMFMLGILGVSQATGHDFFRTTVGMKMITPLIRYGDGSTNWLLIDRMAIRGESFYNFEFNNNEVYQTVYNINYVSFYLCLILPLFAMLFIKNFGKGEGKSRVLGILCLLVYGICLYCFFGANSASGYFGLAVMAISALVMLRKKLKEWIRPLAVLVLVTALIMGCLADRWLPEVKSLVSAVTPAVYGADIPDPASFKNEPGSKKPSVDMVYTGDNYITWVLNGEYLVAILDETGIAFIDGAGEQVPIYLIDDGSNYYMLLDERFHDYIKWGYELPDGIVQLDFSMAGTVWKFRYHEDEGFKFVTPVSSEDNVRETKIGHIESIGFEDHYTFGTNRGYIWSRTLPLLKSRIFIGSGPDTYCYVFPQEDYAAKYTYQHSLNTITDKAHNMYLNNAVGCGVIAALAYTAMIAFVIIDSLRHCSKMKGISPLAEYAGTGAGLGLAGFAVVGLFNDTCPSTSPIFYTFMALAFACGRMVERAEKEQAPAAEQGHDE